MCKNSNSELNKQDRIGGGGKEEGNIILDHLDRIESDTFFLQLPHRGSDILRLSPTGGDLSARTFVDRTGEERKDIIIPTYLPGTIFPKMFWFPDSGPSLGGRSTCRFDGWVYGMRRSVTRSAEVCMGRAYSNTLLLISKIKSIRRWTTMVVPSRVTLTGKLL